MIRSNGIEIARQIERYARKVDDKAKQFVSKLAEYGYEMSEASFPSGYVDVLYKGKEATIYTTTSDAIFIEFGAGFGANHPLANEFGFTPDSWSKDHAQQFHIYHKWTYDGVTYTRIDAQHGMYTAGKIMREEVVRIAQEVFND